MLDTQSHSTLKSEIRKQIGQDMRILESLRQEVRPLSPTVRRILPRTTTSISLVGTDGGNNRIQFDPFLVQLVRVVDSSNNEYCLEAITPTTSVTELSRMQFELKTAPSTASKASATVKPLPSSPGWRECCQLRIYSKGYRRA